VARERRQRASPDEAAGTPLLLPRAATRSRVEFTDCAEGGWQASRDGQLDPVAVAYRHRWRFSKWDLWTVADHWCVLRFSLRGVGTLTDDDQVRVARVSYQLTKRGRLGRARKQGRRCAGHRHASPPEPPPLDLQRRQPQAPAAPAERDRRRKGGQIAASRAGRRPRPWNAASIPPVERRPGYRSG
jgi:hypothetical protein